MSRINYFKILKVANIKAQQIQIKFEDFNGRNFFRIEISNLG